MQSKSQSSVKKVDFEQIIEPIHADVEKGLPVNLSIAVYYSAARNVIDCTITN